MAAEALGGLREDRMHLVQLSQRLRMVKAAYLAGDGAGLGDDIVGGTAGDGADIDGQITETAAVDLRNGRGSGPDRVAALFGRERRVRGAAGEDGAEGDDGRRLIRRAADRAAEIEDIGRSGAEAGEVERLNAGAVALLRGVK